ncbi:hypothetical protein [Pontibacter ramchanderi]|uniref:Uncharacterized protein n=1 Tax=Pontibacter ramchanderi TaxID=1179743 RepID=A0A2N3U6L6_9BACT|nr:hypothetical protein [Pontibacter ramchanderi]PKV62389.1 hypothetical protein BD749_3890 [Pontibacter ramchanderi]
MSDVKERIVKQGFWFYGGSIKKGVMIKAINYDFWYETEKEEGLDMEGEVPKLNENGEMYMITWTDATFNENESFKVGNLDLESTVNLAESVVGKINWIK